MGSFTCSLPRGLAAGDDLVCALFGIPPSDALRPIGDFLDKIHPEDTARVVDALERVQTSGTEYFEDFRVRYDTGWRWIAGRGKLLYADEGEPMLVGINWDISRRKAEEERLSILAKEMDHRVKNGFSVINALIRLGSRSASSIGSFADTLIAQVRAMSDAHRMSAETLRRDHGDTVRLEQIVRMAVAPWLTGNADQVTLIEAAPVELSLNQLSPFAMMVYELATNAAKYGALGTSDGHLQITIDTAEDCAIKFIWDEQVDQAFLQQAADDRNRGSRSGFGTTLLQHCAATLKARLKREMRPEGLLVELRVP